MKITFVCWLWSPIDTWKRNYTYEHVNALERMLKKYVSIPHRLICIGDNPEGINCEFYPIWNDPIVKTPPGHPNCYRRLKMFSEWARQFGDTIVSIDLDCWIRKDITDLFTGGEEFRITAGHSAIYNGSLWMLKTGTRKQVWEDFDPQTSPRRAKLVRHPITQRRFFGSDQAWLSFKIPGEAIWNKSHGVFHYRTDINERPVPEEARIVFFAGRIKPWSPEVEQNSPTIYHDYRQYMKA